MRLPSASCPRRFPLASKRDFCTPHTTFDTVARRHSPNSKMADIKAIKDQIWYIKRDIQNEEKKRDEWATTV